MYGDPVDVRIKKTASLEEFITAWEATFNSCISSHLMPGLQSINGNCVKPLGASYRNWRCNFPKRY